MPSMFQLANVRHRTFGKVRADQKFMHIVKNSFTNVKRTSSRVCSDLESRTTKMINFSPEL